MPQITDPDMAPPPEVSVDIPLPGIAGPVPQEFAGAAPSKAAGFFHANRFAIVIGVLVLLVFIVVVWIWITRRGSEKPMGTASIPPAGAPPPAAGGLPPAVPPPTPAPAAAPQPAPVIPPGYNRGERERLREMRQRAQAAAAANAAPAPSQPAPPDQPGQPDPPPAQPTPPLPAADTAAAPPPADDTEGEMDDLLRSLSDEVEAAETIERQGN